MKLGIVGTGTIVREALPVLKTIPSCEVTALCSTPRSLPAAEELCAQHGIPQAFCDFSAMLRTAPVDTLYIAVPNHLHFDLAAQALMAGRNVILEKPLTSQDREAQRLADLAREKRLFLFEAITTPYLPCYQKIREWLPRLGTVKVVTCNFSQYSRRYDAFRAGALPPVFDPARSGGALMDLNLYNLHFTLGLFGAPERVHYGANIERGIDTGGIVVLEYPALRAVCIAAKDCAGPSACTIEGTEGYIRQDGPANAGGPVTLHLRGGGEETFFEPPRHRMEPEFRAFAERIGQGDLERCYADLESSLLVSRVQTAARLSAGIRFPADEA